MRRPATCELCGERPAKFVCSRCGKAVCERCFDPAAWLCASCLKEVATVPAGLTFTPALPLSWLAVGFALFLIGAVLIALGAILSGAQGVLIIFPFFFIGWPARAPPVVLALMLLSIAFLIVIFLAALKWFSSPWA